MGEIGRNRGRGRAGRLRRRARGRASRRFQRRHGLEPDGVVGAGTAAALNVSAAERLTQIRANLERWRWITQELGERYILVNIADFRVGVVEAGREVLSMPAIVGTAYRRTPDFSGTMSYLEINPTWTVPPKLVREDILPKVRKDPAYLGQKGFRVFEGWSEGAREIDVAAVDWSQVDGESLSYKFRQDPGPQNSLGRIKFMFPNKFDVYLHDTPDKGLFNRAVRHLQLGLHPGRAADRPRRIRPAGRSGLDPGEDPGRDREREDPGHRASRAPGRPSPLLDGLAGRRRAGPIPGGHLSAGCGPVPGPGGAGFGRRANSPDHQVRTRPTSTWTKSDAG